MPFPAPARGELEGMSAFVLEAILLVSLTAQPAGDAGCDPGLRLSGVLADSLVSSVPGRFGVMGLNLVERTSFVLSEGSYFDCDSLPLLPVACAVCYRALPFVGPMIDFAPDSLVVAAWEGDSRASALLATSIGRDRIQLWLRSCVILATTLSDSTDSGLPYATTPWDFMVMLAWMDRMADASGIAGLGTQTISPEILERLHLGAGSLGLMSWDGASFRGALTTRLENGRIMGLTFLTDSVASGQAASDYFCLLLEKLLVENIPPEG